MKKILSFLLALVFLFTASGCKILELYEEEASEAGTPEVSFEPIESEDLPEPTPTENTAEIEEVLPTETPVATPSPTFIQMEPQATITPVEQTSEEKLSAMIPVLDSIIRTNERTGKTYSSENAYVWEALFTVASYWGYEFETDFEGGMITVSGDLIESFCFALFHNLSALPEIPETFGLILRQDDSYTMKSSELGSNYTEIDSFTENDDGSVMLTVYHCSAEDEILSVYEMKLVPQPNDHFAYSIVSANKTA
ncbi:MAG: hypothetical protein IKM38_08215 [Christensenellaceae bacterium]|nr:hypothetical protein [Christensenellaceae bacterium]